METINEPRVGELVPVRKLSELPDVAQLFATPRAVEWAVRQHKREYAKAGALYLIGGRLLAHPARFVAATFDIGRRRLAERGAAPESPPAKDARVAAGRQEAGAPGGIEAEVREAAEQDDAAAAFKKAMGIGDELGLLLDAKGRITPCEWNARQLAAGMLLGVHYDDFRGRICDGERDWTDHDDRELLCSLQAMYRVPKFTLGQVRNGVAALAFERRRDSLTEYVKGLPAWDGTPRIESAFEDAWGARGTAIVRAASRNFFLSLAARALRPGAQVDTLWAFEGPQGRLKSRSFRELGGALHAEISAPIGSADFSRELRGIWIAELSELDALRGREASTVKRLLSAVQDRYVEKYEIRAMSHPRRAVFVATTNEATYWQDSTGARRLVPIPVGDIDLEAIRGLRTPWFAEARERVERGEPWWEFPPAIAEEQEERQQIDPWEDLLRAMIENGRTLRIGTEAGSGRPITELRPWPDGFITSAEILRDWLSLAPHQQGAASGVRLGRVMRRLGFEPARQGKARERGWIKRAADTQEARP